LGTNGAFPFDPEDTDTPLNTEGAEIPTIASSIFDPFRPEPGACWRNDSWPGEIPAQT
jgi:hypothetical protein